MCCKQPLHAVAPEPSICGQKQSEERLPFRLCSCYRTPAKRVSPGGAMPNPGLCRIDASDPNLALDRNTGVTDRFGIIPRPLQGPLSKPTPPRQLAIDLLW